MNDTAPAIVVRELRHSYGSFVALDGIDLEVATGEIFALLGPNGAGKTTTVEILEGYRHRSAGHVAVLGHDPGHPDRAWRSRIGLVLQSASIAEEVTVAEVLTHFALFYPNPRRVDDVIDLVGLTEKRTTRAGNLSGGQQRRLDVGLGIIGRPELLFLDEPTTGFDPEARRQFWTLVRQLRDEGTTIVLTTHYLEEAEALADRVGVIDRGRLLAVDTPKRLGGRDTARAVVRYRGADGLEERLTDAPTALVADLARRFAGEVPELTVTRPTLEDVYLQMIGGQP